MAKPGTLNWALLGLGGGDVEIEGSNIENLGWESFGHKVKNDDGSTLPAGAAVCVKTYNLGSRLIDVEGCDANSTSLIQQFPMGFMKASTANGAIGIVRDWHILTGQNTAGSTVGKAVFLSDTGDGSFSLTPSTTNRIPIGIVVRVHASTGAVYLDRRISHYRIPHGVISELDRKETNCEFRSRPIFVDGDGDGAPTGTAGDENLMMVDGETFEYHIIGTQTIVKPVWTAAKGLDVMSFDETANEGAEFTQGIGARSKSAFTVGTDEFYFEVLLEIDDVTGTDDLCIGLRKAEAYQAAVDDYDEGVWVNINAGDIITEEVLNNASTVSTDSTDNVTDTQAVRIRIEVDLAGDYTITAGTGAAGTDPTLAALTTDATSPITFDAAEVMIPFIYGIQDTDIAKVDCLRWKAGLLR